MVRDCDKQRGSLVDRVLMSGMVASIVFGAFASCNKVQMIPKTSIPDTPRHRAVLDVVEAYRRAMEHRDPLRVLVLVDESYRDNSGTPEPSDDIDFLGLRSVLEGRLSKTKRVGYRLEYRGISFKNQVASVDVWIDATFIYEEAGSAPRYRRFTDHHRFELIQRKKGWRFIAGL